MGRFCQKNTTAKRFIIDVWYGCKYTTVVVQDSKINLKLNEYQNAWENCAFLQCWLCRRYPYVKISQDIRSRSSHMYYYIVVLKKLAKLTEMHLLFQPVTFNFIGKETSTYIDFCEFCKNFQDTFIIWNLLQIAFGLEFYEKWRTEILIIIKIYREVDRSFKKQTLRGKAYIWEPLIECWH